MKTYKLEVQLLPNQGTYKGCDFSKLAYRLSVQLFQKQDVQIIRDATLPKLAAGDIA